MNTHFSQTVFVPIDGQIEMMTLAKYLRRYHSDETTSPRGVEPKLHVSPSLDGESFYVSEWLSGGGKKTLEQFATRDEAQEFILQCWERDWQKSNNNAPSAFFTVQEAEEWIEQYNN